MINKKLYKLLLESVPEKNEQDIILVTNIINSALNNNDWHKDKNSYDAKLNEKEIKQFLHNQISPYEWNDNIKNKLEMFIYKLLLYLSHDNNLKKCIINRIRGSINYDINMLNNMKQYIHKNVKHLIYGSGINKNDIRKLKNKD